MRWFEPSPAAQAIFAIARLLGLWPMLLWHYAMLYACFPSWIGAIAAYAVIAVLPGAARRPAVSPIWALPWLLGAIGASAVVVVQTGHAPFTRSEYAEFAQFFGIRPVGLAEAALVAMVIAGLGYAAATSWWWSRLARVLGFGTLLALFTLIASPVGLASPISGPPLSATLLYFASMAIVCLGIEHWLARRVSSAPPLLDERVDLDAVPTRVGELARAASSD